MNNVVAKMATNISLPHDVYVSARELNINISKTCEQALREVIRVRKDEAWNDQHAAFIETYNKLVETDSVALQEWRSF